MTDVVYREIQKLFTTGQKMIRGQLWRTDNSS